MNVARLTAVVLAIAVLGSPFGAQAQGGSNCSISVSGVNFGNYNVFSGSPVQSTGGLTFRCGPAVQTVQISLSQGQSGTFHSRTLVQGSESLAYNLFRDAGRTEIWGDGSSGTFDVPMSPEKNAWIPLTIYAEIPPLQDVSAGTYTDTIVATVNF